MSFFLLRKQNPLERCCVPTVRNVCLSSGKVNIYAYVFLCHLVKTLNPQPSRHLWFLMTIGAPEDPALPAVLCIFFAFFTIRNLRVSLCTCVPLACSFLLAKAWAWCELKQVCLCSQHLCTRVWPRGLMLKHSSAMCYIRTRQHLTSTSHLLTSVEVMSADW